MRKIILLLSLCFVLSGCLRYGEYSFKFDYNSGKVEKTYHDFRSQKGFDEKEYSIERDWAMLKEATGEEFGDEFDPDVIKPIKAELFQEDEALSGRTTFEVQLPKAFPSKTAILEKLHEEGEEKFEFKILSGEIFLFTQNRNIRSTNGKVIKTAKNNIVVWPGDQIMFEFTVDSDNGGGKSLLPFYLEEKKQKEKKE
ncbi:MAG: hypothetical protein GY853_11935 [PVC group bacterium]|nr:hypothetical protein [PVC group bacterium]